jgi:predicted TIM-barrel fold metal-dependent hydrolase
LGRVVDQRGQMRLEGSKLGQVHAHVIESFLQCALSVLGADRILFSVDCNYTPNHAARTLLDTAPISPSDRDKIAHANADRLLRL